MLFGAPASNFYDVSIQTGKNGFMVGSSGIFGNWYNTLCGTIGANLIVDFKGFKLFCAKNISSGQLTAGSFNTPSKTLSLRHGYSRFC